MSNSLNIYRLIAFSPVLNLGCVAAQLVSAHLTVASELKAGGSPRPDVLHLFIGPAFNGREV